jgi:hypothetical protein
MWIFSLPWRLEGLGVIMKGNGKANGEEQNVQYQSLEG